MRFKRPNYFTDVDDAIGFVIEEATLADGLIVIDVEDRQTYEDFYVELLEACEAHADVAYASRVVYLHDHELSYPARSTVVVLR